MHPQSKTVNLIQEVAGNGLLNRRSLLGRGIALAGTASAGTMLSAASAGAEPLKDAPWSLTTGDSPPTYQLPSKFAKDFVRTQANPNGEPRTSQTRTPLHLMEGTIVPNGLHFTIVHTGVPDIDPDVHRLVIHGLVKRPLIFSLEDLLKYPLVSRISFVECGGNSAPLFSPQPIQATVQALHGLLSCAEWTGVKLSTLLDETGIDVKAKWFIAEGADASHLSRSVPLSKALDDAIIVFYQNGEPLMPGNGYPMRLLLPGYEGNMNVKYLRRIKLVDSAEMSFYESKVYTAPLPSGKAYQFFFINEVKSIITRPSFGYTLKQPGLYEISGIAYSGTGPISKVEVSADGGRSWAMAALQEPVLSKAFTRFRMPWRWDGGPAILQSRAWDASGNVQPTRAEFVAARGELTSVPSVLGFPNHHFNAVMSWAVNNKGEIQHAYA
jgi:sulfane dehydrogenase subunit SoxC